MYVKKIVLATIVFGFVASSALAMENLEKLTANNRWAEIFLLKGTSLRHIGNIYILENSVPFKLPVTLQKYRFFGRRFKIEKAIAENNFIRCNFSSGFQYKKEAIICGTTDEKKCRYAEEFLMAKALGSIPNPAMENLGKLTAKDPETNVFFQTDDSLRYANRACYLSMDYPFAAYKFDLGKAIAAKKFVSCNFSNKEKGIILGTTDTRKCCQAEQLFLLEQERLRRECEDFERNYVKPGHCTCCNKPYKYCGGY